MKPQSRPEAFVAMRCWKLSPNNDVLKLMRKSAVSLKPFILILFFGVSAYAQLPLSAGIKGGMGLTDAYLNNLYQYPAGNAFQANSAAKDWIVGPFVELRLPFHLAVEADALYRPLSLQYSYTRISGIISTVERRNATWEFPILFKYRFAHVPLVKPYIDGGPTFRATSGSSSNLANHGFALGAGLDFRLLLIHISPEIRYNHWGSDSFPADFFQPVHSQTNQAELLVGISF